MPRMLRELEANPEAGLLGASLYLGSPRLPLVVQYWRSFDHLEWFARSQDASHWPAWVAFNKRVGSSGDVGVWHETYLVPAGRYDCVYKQHATDRPRRRDDAEARRRSQGDGGRTGRNPSRAVSGRAPDRADRGLSRPRAAAQPFGCQSPISAPAGAATTLRQPTGPSRGSSETSAPRQRARSVASATSATST
jgi:hypothetical protein